MITAIHLDREKWTLSNQLAIKIYLAEETNLDIDCLHHHFTGVSVPNETTSGHTDYGKGTVNNITK